MRSYGGGTYMSVLNDLKKLLNKVLYILIKKIIKTSEDVTPSPLFLCHPFILLFDPFQFLPNNQPNPRARDPFDPVIYFGETQSSRQPQFREKTILALLMG